LKIEDVIGANIADARKRRGITQADLGIKLGELLGDGWLRQAVWSAERGKRAFTAVELIAFARTLDTTVQALLTPPIQVREIEMPTGVLITHADLFNVSLPGNLPGELLHDMRQTLTDQLNYNEKQKEEITFMASLLDELTAAQHEDEDDDDDDDE